MITNRGLLTVLQRNTALSTRLQTTVGAQEVEQRDVPLKPFEDIPYPKGLPFVKNMFTFMLNIKTAHHFHTKLRKELGDIYRLRLPGVGNDLVFISNPEDSRTLYSKDGEYPFLPGFEVFGKMRLEGLPHLYPDTPGLLTQGESWSKVRRAVQQDMMRPKSALYYVDELNETAQELCDKLAADLDDNLETVKLNYTLQKFAVDATGLMFIGSHLGVIKGNPDGTKLMAAVSGFLARFQTVAFVPEKVLKLTGIYKEVCDNMETMYNICNKKINVAIEKHKTDGSLKGTVLWKLLERCGAESPIPTIMAVDSLSAGIDTTAHTATFLLYHLAINPEKQEILFNEIDRVLGKNGNMTEAKLEEMKYLKACMQESQRIWPVAIGTSRKTQTNMVLSGYHIPADTVVIRNGILSSNDDKFYPNADKFLPERWIRGCPQHQKVDPYANLPFGHGPRACIGQRFARLELYMVAFKIIQQYRLEYHHEPIDVDFTGIGHPDREVVLKMIKRT